MSATEWDEFLACAKRAGLVPWCVSTLGLVVMSVHEADPPQPFYGEVLISTKNGGRTDYYFFCRNEKHAWTMWVNRLALALRDAKARGSHARGR